MGLVTPDYGLLFWMLLSFTILLVILKKFAWKPILQGLKNREESIAKALQQAEEARAELKTLEAANNELAEKSRLEREHSLQQIKLMKDKLVAEAKEEANLEAQRMVEKAREIIKQERETATKELKNSAASWAVEISEMILRKHLTAEEKQAEYIDRLIKEIPQN